MGLSNVLSDYHDIKPILDQAVAHKGGTYQLETSGQAVHWRQRAYKFRKLLRTLRGESRVPGTSVETAYDGLVMDLDGPTVSFSWREPKGTFVAPKGSTAKPVVETLVERHEDDLLAAARKLVEERGE